MLTIVNVVSTISELNLNLFASCTGKRMGMEGKLLAVNGEPVLPQALKPSSRNGDIVEARSCAFLHIALLSGWLLGLYQLLRDAMYRRLVDIEC